MPSHEPVSRRGFLARSAVAIAAAGPLASLIATAGAPPATAETIVVEGPPWSPAGPFFVKVQPGSVATLTVGDDVQTSVAGPDGWAEFDCPPWTWGQMKIRFNRSLDA